MLIYLAWPNVQWFLVPCLICHLFVVPIEANFENVIGLVEAGYTKRCHPHRGLWSSKINGVAQLPVMKPGATIAAITWCRRMLNKEDKCPRRLLLELSTLDAAVAKAPSNAWGCENRPVHENNHLSACVLCVLCCGHAAKTAASHVAGGLCFAS